MAELKTGSTLGSNTILTPSSVTYESLDSTAVTGWSNTTMLTFSNSSTSFGELDLPGREVKYGENVYTSAGTYTWEVPEGVEEVSMVAIGGGGSGAIYIGNSPNAGGGAGGGLAWVNNVKVTAGQSYTVVVGAGGAGVPRGSPGGADGNNGSPSYISNSLGTLLTAGGGSKGTWNAPYGTNAPGGTYSVSPTVTGVPSSDSGGGNGGDGYNAQGTGWEAGGGGGAGGYLSDGGDGSSNIASDSPGGGGGGGASAKFPPTGPFSGTNVGGDGGKGTVYGYTEGYAVDPSVNHGRGGWDAPFYTPPSYPSTHPLGPTYPSSRNGFPAAPPANYGFGQGGAQYPANYSVGRVSAGNGAVRIMWGFNRYFANTNATSS